MKKILTISRQLGSGGWQIGKTLSEELGVPFYDKEIIKIAAKESGVSEEILKYYDERQTNSLLYSLSLGSFSAITDTIGGINVPINDKVFEIQRNIIKRVADEGPCVIIGRCSDYILSDRDDVVNVFIYCDSDKRYKRIAERDNITISAATEFIKKTDRNRANYHNYYADNKWGEINSYDMCINSKIGIRKCVEILKTVVSE